MPSKGGKKKRGVVIKAGCQPRVEHALLQRFKMVKKSMDEEAEAEKARLAESEKSFTDSFMAENASCFEERSIISESTDPTTLQAKAEPSDEEIDFG